MNQADALEYAAKLLATNWFVQYDSPNADPKVRPGYDFAVKELVDLAKSERRREGLWNVFKAYQANEN